MALLFRYYHCALMLAGCTAAASIGLSVARPVAEARAEAPVQRAAVIPGQIVGMRRLTEAQYRNAVADIFGTDIKIGGRFEPILRPSQGLVATGAAQSSISPAGFEQFDAMARLIASQVLDQQHRATFLPCQPADARQADDSCARRFFASIGPYVLRRDLKPVEVDNYVDLAARGTKPTNNFYSGLELGLASMLVSPEFLYQVEAAGPDGRQLDGFSKASRLSFLLWNSVPDRALLDAARGDLNTPEGLSRQVDRMLASPKAEQGMRAFFTDFLELDRVADLSKDTVVYDRYTAEVAKSLSEQTLRTVVDLLLTRGQPYPDLFTTRDTFMNRTLGVVYHVPVPPGDAWVPYRIPESEDRSGILGQESFLALFSHEGRSSPTLRGRAIREVLLCQPVPNPPANVDFSGFNDSHNAVLKTARQRLVRHANDPSCASCHRITDPLGLPLEHFDGVGATRETENGAMIDVSGSFEGKSFDGAAALGALLSQSKSPSECLTQRIAEYASGLDQDHLPDGWLDMLNRDFEAQGFKFRGLLRDVALSPQFFAAPLPAPTPAQVADNSVKTRR